MAIVVLRRASDGFFGRLDADQPAADDDSDSDILPGVAREVIACAVVMIVLAAAIVGLRTYCRAYVLRKMGKDDWVIIVGLVFSIGNSVGMVLQAKHALGRHIWDLTPDVTMLFLKEAYFTILSYNAGLACTKLSILLLYLRLFSSAHVTLRRVTYALMAIVLLVSLWAIFSSAFFCLPVASFWDHSIKASSCLPREPRWFSGASLNIITDFMIIILPLPVITKMNLPKAQKIVLHMVFIVGFFVCIVSIFRLKALIKAFHSKDPSWDNPDVAKWSIIEINTAIICPCIATLKPLASRMFTRPTGQPPERGGNSVSESGQTRTIGSGGRGSWFRHLASQKLLVGTNTTLGETLNADKMDVDTSSTGNSDVELGKTRPVDE